MVCLLMYKNEIHHVPTSEKANVFHGQYLCFDGKSEQSGKTDPSEIGLIRIIKLSDLTARL